MKPLPQINQQIVEACKAANRDVPRARPRQASPPPGRASPTRRGKLHRVDADIRVPVILTGPGVPAGKTIDEIALNIDLHSTFTELDGAATSADVDDLSLVPLLRGEPVSEWRSLVLIEHRGPHRDRNDPDAPGARSGNPPTYESIRGQTFL